MTAEQDYQRLYQGEIGRRLESLDRTLREAIERFDIHNNQLTKEINDLRVEVRVNANTLALKSSIWGALSGLAVGIGMILLFVATHVLH